MGVIVLGHAKRPVDPLRRPLAEKLVEQPPPNTRVQARRLGHDTVKVEQDRIDAEPDDIQRQSGCRLLYRQPARRARMALREDARARGQPGLGPRADYVARALQNARPRPFG